jgi:hypothetical protein
MVAAPAAPSPDLSYVGPAAGRNQPTGATHAAISIFLIAATDPASYNLEGSLQSPGSDGKERFDCRVAARGNIDRTGVGDALRKRSSLHDNQ